MIKLICCSIELELDRNPLEDEESWQSRCPACGKEWWLELIGPPEEQKQIHVIPEHKHEREHTLL